jgi:hypothetical protein
MNVSGCLVAQALVWTLIVIELEVVATRATSRYALFALEQLSDPRPVESYNGGDPPETETFSA